MSYSRLIHDYLDSGLDGSTEEVLFSELARNNQLRNEFNQQMKIHLIAKEDYSKIAPPAAVTNAVFAGLGFSMPTSVYYSSQIDGETGKTSLKRFVKRNSAWLLLLLLSFSAIPFAYYYNANNNGNSNSGNFRNDTKNAVPFVSSVEEKSSQSIDANEGNSANPNSSLSGLVQSGNSNNSNLFAGNNGTKNNRIANKNNKKSAAFNEAEDANLADNSNVGDNSNSSDLSSMESISKSSVDSRIKNNSSKLFSSSVNGGKVPNRFVNNTNIIGSISDLISMLDNNLLRLSDSKYQINLRAISPTSNYPDFSLINQNEFYNNLALSGMYNFDDNHSLGIELGNERFNQQFTYKNNGLNYIQSPIIYYVGANYKFNARNLILENYFYPYASVLAGATNVGPIFKSQIGFNWDISMPIHLQLGMEYGLIYYNVDNHTYNSEKLGFTFGLNYNF